MGVFSELIVFCLLKEPPQKDVKDMQLVYDSL